MSIEAGRVSGPFTATAAPPRPPIEDARHHS